MTEEFSPTSGMTRMRRRPRLTMRLHPRGGDLSADATGRQSLCRHPQFASATREGSRLEVDQRCPKRPIRSSTVALTRRACAPVEIRPRPQRGPGRSRSARLRVPPPGVSPPASRRPVRHPHGSQRITASGIPWDRLPTATPKGAALIRPSRAEPPECRAAWVTPNNPGPLRITVSRTRCNSRGPVSRTPRASRGLWSPS